MQKLITSKCKGFYGPTRAISNVSSPPPPIYPCSVTFGFEDEIIQEVELLGSEDIRSRSRSPHRDNPKSEGLPMLEYIAVSYDDAPIRYNDKENDDDIMETQLNSGDSASSVSDAVEPT